MTLFGYCAFSQLRKASISDEISQADVKIDQMATIIGNDVSRDRLANFLDGAGGNVQVALEHYFMSVSSLEAPPQPPTSFTPADSLSMSMPPPPPPAPPIIHPARMEEPQVVPPRRPLSELILPIPAEPLPPPMSTPGRYESSATPVDFTSTAVGEPSPGIPVTVKSMMTAPLSLPAAAPAPTIVEDKVCLERATSDALSVEEMLLQAPDEALTIQDFEMLSVLGKGSFGAVMLVRFKKDGRVFALKIIKKTNMDRSDVENAMEERQILQRINHPYICGLVFAFQTNERLYLGMKYYAAGDLFYHLNLKGRLDVKDAKLYGAELVLAISYLHKLNILYRDLKPSNVMIDSEGHIGVVDFGLSKQHIKGSSAGVKTLSGTAEYVAPEALAQTADGSRNYGKAYDWWSLGIVLVRYECCVCGMVGRVRTHGDVVLFSTRCWSASRHSTTRTSTRCSVVLRTRTSCTRRTSPATRTSW